MVVGKLSSLFRWLCSRFTNSACLDEWLWCQYYKYYGISVSTTGIFFTSEKLNKCTYTYPYPPTWKEHCYLQHQVYQKLTKSQTMICLANLGNQETNFNVMITNIFFSQTLITPSVYSMHWKAWRLYNEGLSERFLLYLLQSLAGM